MLIINLERFLEKAKHFIPDEQAIIDQHAGLIYHLEQLRIAWGVLEEVNK